MSDAAHFAANVERYMGFADIYDRYRPTPPAVIVDVLTQLARTPRPRCVVDLGSGTGLSTRIWASRADLVVGVEPGDDMRRQAETASAGLSGVRYIKGLSTETGLADASADIVTVSQAFHWMEPTGTLAEAARLLRPGGLFAAIDCDWPQTFDWEAELADEAFMAYAGKLATEGNYEQNVRRWPKSEHYARIRNSGYFRWTKEIALHGAEPGDADRMVGIALSQGIIQNLLKKGISEEQIGIPAFRAEAQRILGDGTITFYFTYRLRIGIK